MRQSGRRCDCGRERAEARMKRGVSAAAGRSDLLSGQDINFRVQPRVESGAVAGKSCA